MKRFELVKREDHYGLYNEDGHKIAATIDGCNSKLSKENCDEIFGVVDVEMLAVLTINEETTFVGNEKMAKGFIKGFNKAIELNKDKLFTEFDIIKAFEYGWNQRHFNKTDEDELREIQEKFIQSLQQPTEIEVEIEMNIIPELLKGSYPEEKLDENGCLILKKK